VKNRQQIDGGIQNSLLVPKRDKLHRYWADYVVGGKH